MKYQRKPSIVEAEKVVGGYVITMTTGEKYVVPEKIFELLYEPMEEPSCGIDVLESSERGNVIPLPLKRQ